MKKDVITPALHVLGGLLGGAIVSLVVTHSIATQRGRAAVDRPSAVEMPARLASADQNAWLEWRLRRLEDTAAAAAGSADTKSPSATPEGDAATRARAYSEADMRAEQQRHIREYEDAIRAHDGEPLDARWADDTTPKLRTELASLAEASHFAVTAVDCKTTTCKAVFRWPSYEAAVDASPKLLHQMYEANCTRTILLPPPADPNLPYEGRMLFDCEE